jgi:Holliday junction resolvase RusA-like endonuclease
MITFFVAGVPIAQPRVRACIRGKHAGVYDPGTANEWKNKVMSAGTTAAYRPELGTKFEIIIGPVGLTLHFYLPRPKHHFRSNCELKQTAPWWHTSKPDLDNLEKAVKDAITQIGVIWADDSQVCMSQKTKIYATNESPVGVRVTIEKL